jgi:hypothetical protein
MGRSHRAVIARLDPTLFTHLENRLDDAALRNKGKGAVGRVVGEAVTRHFRERQTPIISRYTTHRVERWRLTPSSFALRATADRSAPTRPILLFLLIQENNRSKECGEYCANPLQPTRKARLARRLGTAFLRKTVPATTFAPVKYRKITETKAVTSTATNAGIVPNGRAFQPIRERPHFRMNVAATAFAPATNNASSDRFLDRAMPVQAGRPSGAPLLHIDNGRGDPCGCPSSARPHPTCLIYRIGRKAGTERAMTPPFFVQAFAPRGAMRPGCCRNHSPL